jgi:hypothetical protein
MLNTTTITTITITTIYTLGSLFKEKGGQGPSADYQVSSRLQARKRPSAQLGHVPAVLLKTPGH